MNITKLTRSLLIISTLFCISGYSEPNVYKRSPGPDVRPAVRLNAVPKPAQNKPGLRDHDASSKSEEKKLLDLDDDTKDSSAKTGKTPQR